MQDPSVALAAFVEIGIIDQLAKNEFQKALPPGLSLAGFNVLDRFARLAIDAESPGRLAEVFQVTAGTMTNTIQRLEKAGYVTITPDPAYWRSKVVTPTPEGLKARDVALANIVPVLKACAETVGEAQLSALVSRLSVLRAYLDGHRVINAPS